MLGRVRGGFPAALDEQLQDGGAWAVRGVRAMGASSTHVAAFLSEARPLLAFDGGHASGLLARSAA